MEAFFRATLKPYLWISGICTFSVLSAFLAPQFTLRTLYGYDDSMLQGYEYWGSLFQHWGIMVVGVAAQLLYSIRHPQLRGMAMAFSGGEKAIFVAMFVYQYFVLGNGWFIGFVVIFIHDSIVTLYSFFYVIYLATRDKSTPPAHLSV